jgi:hypothetical protein
MKEHYGQSNFDKRLSIWFFLSYLITTVDLESLKQQVLLTIYLYFNKKKTKFMQNFFDIYGFHSENVFWKKLCI